MVSGIRTTPGNNSSRRLNKLRSDEGVLGK